MNKISTINIIYWFYLFILPLPYTVYGNLAEKDLAIILDASLKEPIRAGTKIGNTALLPSEWYKEVLKLYNQSEIGSGLEEENVYNEWRLISLRIAPCQPLVRSMTHSPHIYCWPQVRLVMQPVIEKLRLFYGRTVYNYADDRAIHMLYNVNLSGNHRYLSSVQKQRLEFLKEKITTAKQEHNNREFIPLNKSEKIEFIELRNKVSQRLITDVLALRDPAISVDQFSEHGIRPEVEYTDTVEFRKNLVKFLGKYTDASHLTKLTSFSLPSGRDPVQLDLWVFLSFEKKSDNRISPKESPIFDQNTGKTLTTLPAITTGSMRRDSEIFYEMYGQLNTTDFNQLESQVLIYEFGNDNQTATNILNPHMISTDNTSCASCHRLNNPHFNFHNLSKLNEDSTTISERVINDVAYDMLWIKKHLE